MGREDWYRNTSWTPAVQASFFERLRRSRSAFHKSQYLRIQAHSLAATAEPALMAVALQLLDTLFTECPEESELAAAHLLRAECLLAQHDEAGAVGAFAAAMEAERHCPNVKTSAWLDFAWFVATRGHGDLRDRALAALDEFGPPPAHDFPLTLYRYHASRALLLAAAGQGAAAARDARSALEAAARDHSGFRYHQQLGLVREQDGEVAARLAQLAGSEP